MKKLRILRWCALAALLGAAPARAKNQAATQPPQPAITYGGLADKGLHGDAIPSDKTPFPRPRPSVCYLSQGPTPQQRGSAEEVRTPITLLERSKPAQARTDGDVAFGFPLAQGALFDLQKLRLTGEDGVELPTQATALALWPDGSIKSAYIQGTATVKASEKKRLFVEFGNAITRAAAPLSGPLQVKQHSQGFTVSTGKINVEVGTNGFVPFKEVHTASRQLVAKGGALEITDEHGTLFTSAHAKPESITIERQGPLDTVLRLEGKYGDAKKATFMRYIARLRFRANSSRVDLTLTHVNDELQREFTDFSRLGMGLDLATQNDKATPLQASVRLTQWDADTSELNGKASSLRSSGGISLLPASGEGVQLALRHFWQRWPKAVEARPDHLQVEFLPKLPSPEFGKDFPSHLAFPFVEGRYRLKWGMSFTERMTFDFRATEPVAELEAEVNSPLLAQLPPAYVASTGVFGPVHTPEKTPSALAQQWEAYISESLQNLYTAREEQKEYGYLNWGDWFGERGRNWGNNEYDLPHGFFAHYLATGKPEYFENALSGARHQADVDIVHAYPDPAYIGANLQHSIGHSGISYQRVAPTWTYQYDGATSAGNGHTWSDGMADCWLLTGDPVVMEALLALGEHIRWAFVPKFKTLASLERTGGWSIQAALGAYRATSDPAYLEAASTIAALALKEQDPASGIWPHVLPPTHASNKEGVVGNSNYNIGILLTGLGKYHAVTQDPKVLASLVHASAWFERSWQEKSGGWPYSSAVDGTAVTRNTSPNLNPLIYPALAYVGLVTKDAKKLELARKAIATVVAPGKADKLVKEYSIKCYATTETFAYLALASEAGLIEVALPLPPPTEATTAATAP